MIQLFNRYLCASFSVDLIINTLHHCLHLAEHPKEAFARFFPDVTQICEKKRDDYYVKGGGEQVKRLKDFLELSCGELKSWVKNFTGSETVVYKGMAINWRGAMAPKAFKFLRDVCRLSLIDIQFLSVKTVMGSFYLYVTFKRSTYQVGGS